MSSAALATVPSETRALSIAEMRMSVTQLVEQRKAIVEAMKSTMVEGIDFGTIPGTLKPCLYKPGSEKIMALFHLGARPRIEDVSTPDTIRYRVTVELFHQPTGTILGEGVGEASSAESKYQWREAICQQEWDETAADRKRRKWKKPDKYHREPYVVLQLRAEMEDVANTILKMSKKRGQIDSVLTATAASDIFSQDLEDLKDAGFDLPPEDGGNQGGDGQQAPTQNLPTDLPRKSPPAATQAASAGGPPPQTNPAPPAQSHPAQSGGHVQIITEGQAKRFWAVAMQTWQDHRKIMDYLRNVVGVQKKDDIPTSSYDAAMLWAEGK